MFRLIKGCAILAIVLVALLAGLVLAFAVVPRDSWSVLLVALGGLAVVLVLLAVRLDGLLFFLAGRRSVRRRR